MPDFIWHAATAGGQVEQGRLSAANAALALKQLRAQGLKPLHLADASAAAGGAGGTGARRGGVGGAAGVQALLDAVKGGTPLSRALAAHGPLFGDFYINMVRSGEASGQMSAVL